MSKRSSCSNCWKIKRKCDGNKPCSTCVRRKTTCEFNQEDRRHQRFSTGYVKSLETNVQFVEGIIAHLVKIRNDPESVAAKLESLASSYQETSELFAADPDIQPRRNDPNSAPIIAPKNQYFGPGSIYHYRNADEAPLMELETHDYESNSDQNSALKSENTFDPSPGNGRDLVAKGSQDLPVTLEEDYEYVSNLVHGYIKDCHPSTASLILDIGTILPLFKQQNYSTPFLNKPLVYAICALNERIKHKESQQYFDLSLRMLLHKQRFNSSLAISQSYTLLGMHAISKGEGSRGWNLVGLGRSVGMDVGFDESHAQQEGVQAIYNRCYMATLLIEAYLALAVGRKRTMARISSPVLKLPSESNEDFLNVKYSIELVEYTKHMLRSTYQPVQFHEDSSINYLVKFNRAKKYNILVLQWKQSLDPSCDWSYKSMKSDDKLAYRNHTLKITFYYIILFLNKPFYHVPKKYSTVFLIEEMANELYLIVQSYLKKMEREKGINIPLIPRFNVFHEDELYCSASMELCVLMVLCHVIVTLIISSPDQYGYLGKHFKLFAIYLSFCTPRKYNAPINPIKVLWQKYSNFKYADKTFQNYSNMDIGHSKETASGSGVGVSENKVNTKNLEAFASHSKGTSESGSSEDFKVSPRTLSDTEGRIFEPIFNQDSMEIDPDAPSNFSRFLNDEKLLDVYKQGNEHKVNGAGDAKFYAVPNNNAKVSSDSDFSNPYFQGIATNESNLWEPQQGMPYNQPDTYTTNYDQMAVFVDPLDQLFSNSGQEFEVPHPMVDWDLLFQNQYPNMGPT